MSNPNDTHQFTQAEVVKISAIVQRRLIALVPALINDAIAEVVNVSLDKAAGKATPEAINNTKARILNAMSKAPTLVDKFPNEARFLANYSMTKTTLRRAVSNSDKAFAQALDDLVMSGSVKHIKAISAHGRLQRVYGLAHPPAKGKPAA